MAFAIFCASLGIIKPWPFTKNAHAMTPQEVRWTSLELRGDFVRAFIALRFIPARFPALPVPTLPLTDHFRAVVRAIFQATGNSAGRGGGLFL